MGRGGTRKNTAGSNGVIINFDRKIMTRNQKKLENEEISKKRKTSEEETDEEMEEVDMSSLDESQQKLVVVLYQLLNRSTKRLEKKIADLKEKYDREMEEIKTRLTELEEDKIMKDCKIRELQKEVDHIQQQTRKKNLIIHGIPDRQEEPNSDTYKFVQEVFKKGFEANFETETVRRIGKFGDQPRRILVKLKNETDIEKIMKTKHKLKNFPQMIYINRDLAPNVAREMANKRRAEKERKARLHEEEGRLGSQG